MRLGRARGPYIRLGRCGGLKSDAAAALYAMVLNIPWWSREPQQRMREQGRAGPGHYGGQEEKGYGKKGTRGNNFVFLFYFQFLGPVLDSETSLLL